MGGANAAPAPGLPASSCPAYGHLCFVVPISDDTPSGFVTADLMTTTGYTTENVWVELGQNATTSGILVEATGASRVQLGSQLNVKLDRNNGRMEFLVAGTYQVVFSVTVKRIEGASGQREMIGGAGINGSPPVMFIQAATTQQGTRWVTITSPFIFTAQVGDTVSVWLNQINDDGGSGADDMEVAAINLTAVRLV